MNYVFKKFKYCYCVTVYRHYYTYICSKLYALINNTLKVLYYVWEIIIDINVLFHKIFIYFDYFNKYTIHRMQTIINMHLYRIVTNNIYTQFIILFRSTVVTHE